MIRIVILICAGGLLLSGCVSKKNYLSAVARYDQEIDSLRTDLARRQGVINSNSIELAKLNGANAALLTTQDKLQDRINALQAEIDGINKRMSSTQQDLTGQLQSRDNEIAARQAKIDAVRQLVKQRESELQALAQAVKDSLGSFPTNRFLVEVKANQAIITFNEGLLFVEGATGRIERDGLRAISKVAGVLRRYPAVMIQVTGHTDNQNVPRRSVDNWDYSVLRAATVAKALINDYNLESNRVSAAGKGPFAPRTSNETSEGRAENRRIELVVTFRDADLLRDIDKLLQ
jgi:chemotaxis protein MotB